MRRSREGSVLQLRQLLTVRGSTRQASANSSGVQLFPALSGLNSGLVPRSNKKLNSEQKSDGSDASSRTFVKSDATLGTFFQWDEGVLVLLIGGINPHSASPQRDICFIR